MTFGNGKGGGPTVPKIGIGDRRLQPRSPFLQKAHGPGTASGEAKLVAPEMINR